MRWRALPLRRRLGSIGHRATRRRRRADVQAQQAELRQYEYSPLAQIQGWSEIERGAPLFESLLVFENYPIGGAVQEGRMSLAIEWTNTVEQTNYPLTFVISPGQQ